MRSGRRSESDACGPTGGRVVVNSVARAVVEFDDAVQAPWRPPLGVVSGGRCTPQRLVPSAGSLTGVGSRIGVQPGPALAGRRGRGPATGPGNRPLVGSPAGREVRDRRRVSPVCPDPVRVRLTRRGRRLGVVVGLVVGGVIGTWLGAVMTGEAGSGLQLVGERSVVVQSGDTLWSIASSAVGDDVDVRVVVDRIEELNGLEGASIMPGQVLQLP
jgi:nucleoid-associated protein YgaU